MGDEEITLISVQLDLCGCQVVGFENGRRFGEHSMIEYTPTFSSSSSS